MLKRRNNTVPCSSSSYRENTNASDNLHSKSLGCMSGIFHFISKYHHNRKSLTFGGKKKTTSTEKNIIICSSTKPPSSPAPSPTKAVHSPPPPPDQTNVEESSAMVVQQPPRFSCCEVAPDRSPAIPPEIRRSNSVNSPANFHPSSPSSSPRHSVVVARLMGLTSSVPSESTSEKRRKLMGALEKCDQDLKALKKIIDAVQSADLTTHFTTDPTAQTETKTMMSDQNEQPSPVSVLDELTRSPPTLTQARRDRRQSNEFRLKEEEKKKSSREEEDRMVSSSSSAISLFDRMIKAATTESIPTLTMMKRPDDGDVAWACTMKTTLSRGMIECVEQVCKDIAWGQKREVGRIGLALQDHICRDLIEEMVMDQLQLAYISSSYPIRHVVPRFEACKRSLRF